MQVSCCELPAEGLEESRMNGHQQHVGAGWTNTSRDVALGSPVGNNDILSKSTARVN